MNDLGNMTLAVEVYDVEFCLDIIEMLAQPGNVAYGVCQRLSSLLQTPWPDDAWREWRRATDAQAQTLVS